LWIKVFFPVLAIAYLIMGSFAITRGGVPAGNLVIGCLIAGAVTALIFGAIGVRMSRRFMGFVQLAEGVFEGFGWKDVRNIDLPAMTKKTKRQGDPGALGVLYFRY
jgi:hypothetical protein